MITDIKLFHGQAISNWIEQAAKLRLSEFKEFPYLYVGNMDAERKYLTCYSQDSHSIFAIAFCNNEIAGITTGIPLINNAGVTTNMPEIFKKNGFNPQDYYYCGEFIVLPKYRGQGIAKQLFTAQSDYIKKCGYKSLFLMTVDREPNHPLKPKDYVSTDPLWEKLGFVKTHMKLQQSWPTMMPNGEVTNINNSLSFWIKAAV